MSSYSARILSHSFTCRFDLPVSYSSTEPCSRAWLQGLYILLHIQINILWGRRCLYQMAETASPNLALSPVSDGTPTTRLEGCASLNGLFPLMFRVSRRHL